MNLRVCSKTKAELQNWRDNWACISISTKPQDFAKLEGINPKNLLQLAFCDRFLVAGSKSFDLEDAAKIIEFYQNLDAELLIIHCEMGVSRSPAVAAALDKIFIHSGKDWKKDFIPNRFVYQTLLDYAYKKGFLSTL